MSAAGIRIPTHRAPRPDHGFLLRVRGTHSGRWCLERYSGIASVWFAIAYYMDRDRAFDEAKLRRWRDGAILACAACDGGIVGDDMAMTCCDCGMAIYPRQGLELKPEPKLPSLRGLNAYTITVAIAAILLLFVCLAGAR